MLMDERPVVQRKCLDRSIAEENSKKTHFLYLRRNVRLRMGKEAAAVVAKKTVMQLISDVFTLSNHVPHRNRQVELRRRGHNLIKVLL